MCSSTTIPVLTYPQEYFYGLSLVVAAIVNFVLASMLLFDSNNDLYTETPRYLRSRRLTGMALAVFGCGFLLHWFFLPHFTNLLMGKALSFSYFHIGGVLFSMSHTGLIDRHYLTRRVVVRDVTLLLISLVVYWVNVWVADLTLTYVCSLLFFLHIGYLTWVFYSRFHRIYRQLGNYAKFLPNDTDREVLWLHISCHLIIAFGIGGMLCTVLFHDQTVPFILLLIAGIAVFTYIYKSLDNFSVVALDADSYLQKSEEYLQTNKGKKNMLVSDHNQQDNVTPVVMDENRARIERWVAERHFTNGKLTFSDAIAQMDITAHALYYYLENHTPARDFRQWLVHLRIEESKRLMISHPNYTIQAIAEACGYTDRSNFSRSFKSHEGIAPAVWMARNQR